MNENVQLDIGGGTETGRSFALRGIEPDNLLSFLALLGALRAIEHERPEWRPRAWWSGPPWLAHLSVDAAEGEEAIAAVAAAGCEHIAASFDVDGRSNVKFTREQYRTYAARMRAEPIGARLAAALTSELPERPDGTTQPSPLVLMFGQGHQNFLDRLLAVPRGELPSRFRKQKNPPDMRDPKKIAEALFSPWRRDDDADAFRWDPEEDQRYALRFDDPSSAGAAATVHGANRLAALGFLSYPCVPHARRSRVRGVMRSREGTFYVWPIWDRPLSLAGIEALLAHPAVVRGQLDRVGALGVREILRAQRIANGKFMNVTRATPYRPTTEGKRGAR